MCKRQIFQFVSHTIGVKAQCFVTSHSPLKNNNIKVTALYRLPNMPGLINFQPLRQFQAIFIPLEGIMIRVESRLTPNLITVSYASD